MAILNHGSTIRTADGGQSTTTIVTASNIGSYAVASNATYYIGTTQNVFNRASGAQTLTGVSIDGNAANITAYTINQNVGTSNTPSFAGIVSSAITNYAYLQVTDVNNFWITPGNNNWGLYFETSAGGLLGGSGDSNRLGFVGAGAARFYVDLNNGNGWFGASLTANTDSRAPIFYDSNNTAYYIDPASTSIVNSFKVYDALYFGDYTTYLSQATPYLRITTANGYGNFGPANSSWFHMTTDRPNFYMAVGLHVNGDMFIYNTQSQLTSTSVRAPIFYDSGDTTYYLDPANSGTSLLVAGKVGIGTTSPSVKLDIASTQGDGIVMRYDTSTAYQAWIRPYWNSGTDTRIDFAINRSANVTPTVIMSVGYGSNVGIGTTSPNTKFEVSGPDASTIQAIFQSSTGAAVAYNGGIQLGNGSSNQNSQIYHNSSGDNTLTFVSNYGGGTANKFVFAPGGTERVRFQQNGNVGIGTISPSQKLHVVGTGFASADFRAPIFYDSDNTAYYANPSGASIFNGLKLVSSGNQVSGDDYSLWIQGGNDDWGIGIDKSSANYGITYNLAASHTYAIQGRKNGTEYFRLGTDMLSHDTRLQAPIFYDSNNTVYYIDPASTSNINVLAVGSTLTFGSWAVNTFSASVNTSTYWTVVRPNGGAIANGYVYRITLVTTGTGTDTGEQYLLANVDSAGWVVKTITKTGSGSNWPYVFLDGGVPKVKNDHPSLYSTTILVEEFNTGNTGGLPSAFGLEGLFTSDNGVPKYRAGWFSSDNTLLHSGNYSGYSTFSGSVTAQYGSFATPSLIMGDAQYGFYVVSGNVYYKSASGGVHYWRNIANSANTMSLDNSGILTVSGNLSAPIFYDSNDTAYYVDPNSVSRLASLRVYSAFDTASSDVYANMRVMRNNATTDGMYIGYGNSGSTSALTRIFGGGATTGELSKYSNYTLEPGSFRSPIFYDSNNTSYYLDAASTSIINILTVSKINNFNGAITTWHTSSEGKARFYFADSASTYFGTGNNFVFRNTSDGGVLTIDGSGNLRTTTGGDNFASYSLHVGGTGFASTDFRAPIFYDSGNTAYYIDPASTSVLNAAQITTTYTNTIAKLTNGSPIVINSGLNASGYALRVYYDMQLYNTLTFTDSAWNSQGSINGSSSVVNINAATATTTFTKYAGYSQEGGSFRAPLFYDSNDTAYYTDPAGFSLISSMGIGGLTSSNNVQMYDSYVDGSSSYLQSPPLIIRKDSSATGAIDQAPVGLFIYNLNGTNNTWTKLSMGSREAVGAGNTVSIAGLAAQKTAGTANSWATGDLHFWTKSGATQITNMVAYSSGYVQSGYSFRAPIFYDSNDTTYYTDPSSLSNILELKTNKNWYDSSASAWGGGINMGGNNPSIGFQSTASTWWYMLHHSSSNINFYRRSTSGSWNHDGIWDSSGNLIWQGSSVRAPIFYDQNNTAYYCDPNSTSNFVGLTVANTITGSISGNAATASNATQFGGESNTNFLRGLSSGTEANINNYTDNGFRVVSYTGHSKGLLSFSPGGSIGTVQHEYFYSIPTNGWRVRNKTDSTTWSAWGNVVMTDTNQGALTGTVITTGNSSGLSPTFTNLYANVFYDQNNTAYYVDAASTSILNTIRLAGKLTNNGSVADDDGFGIYWENTESTSYAIYREAGSWTNPFPDLRIAFHTGIKLGANAGYNGIRFYNDYTMATQVMSVNNGSDGLGADNVYVNNSLQAGSSLRSPIYYDSDNTAYYINAASTSSLNALNLADSVDVGTSIYIRNNLRMLNSAGNGWLETIVRNSGSPYFTNPIDGGTFLASDTSENNNWLFQENARGWGLFYFNRGTQSGQTFGSYTTIGAETFIIGQGTGTTMTSAWTGYNASSKVAIMLSNYTGYIWANDTIFSATGMRAPIFYDSNDTAYYVDPNSLSNIRHTIFHIGSNLVGATGVGVLFDGNYTTGQYRHRFRKYDDGAGLPLYIDYAHGTANSFTTIARFGGGGAYNPFSVYGTADASGDFRAPIFYDSNDTGYYIDAASTSSLNSLISTEVYARNWFRNNDSGEGIYNQATTQHFYSDDVSYWNVASSSGVQGIRFRTGGHGGTVRGYVYANDSNDVGLLNNGGNWRIRVVAGDYTIFDGSSVRAQTFIDSNNTAYHVDPGSTSNLNNLNTVDGNLELYKSQTVDMSNTTTYSTSNYYPVTIPVPTEGCIIQIQNNLNSNVPSWATHGGGFTLNLRWRTNGSGWGTTEVRRYIEQYHERFANQTICGGITQMGNSSTEVVWLRGGGQYYFKFSRNLSATAQSATYTINSQSVSPTSTAQNTIWNGYSGYSILYNNQTVSTDNMYTPVLYDWNNSAYYVDPASTSNLVGLTVANTITGSVSGNAVTAGGLAVHSARNDEANKIVRTDSNGYIQAGWINTTSGDNGTTAIDRVYASSDGYIRYYTPANFRTVLDVPTRGGSGASGSWGISITGNAATATSATTATGLNSSNYISRVGSSGNYNTDFQNTPAGTVRHLGDDANATNNPGGSWWFVDNYRHSNGSNYWGTQVAWGWEDQANKLATRNITGGTFGSWVYYLNSGNYSSYAIARGGDTVDGITLFRSNKGATSTVGSSNTYALQTYSSDAGAAGMSFHRGGYYAVNMGLDPDNIMRIGGWSAAANRWELDMSGNNWVASSFRAPIFYDSNNTAYYLDPASTSVLNRINLNTAATAYMQWRSAGQGTISGGFPFYHNASYGSINIEVSDNDTGGLVIDNEGVTVYGAGDNGQVFRVIDEDVYQATSNITASTTFYVNQLQNGGGGILGPFSISGTATAASFSGAGTGLTGTAASLSIGGNAANVTGTVAIANGGTGATTNANARTNLGATTVGSNLFTLTNPSAITFLRVNADNTVSALNASDFRNAIGAGGGGVTVETSVTQSLSGTTGCTIDVAAANVHILSLANATTISSFTYNNRNNNPSVNTLMIVLKYAGNASITWTNVIWSNNINPTLTQASGYADVFMLTSYKGGAGTPVWIGTVVAAGLVSTNL